MAARPSITSRSLASPLSPPRCNLGNPRYASPTAEWAPAIEMRWLAICACGRCNAEEETGKQVLLYRPCTTKSGRRLHSLHGWLLPFPPSHSVCQALLFARSCWSTSNSFPSLACGTSFSVHAIALCLAPSVIAIVEAGTEQTVLLFYSPLRLY